MHRSGSGTDRPTTDVVWIDGDSELLVRPDQARLVLRPGLVLAGIAVSTDQTDDVEIVVPFAVGSPGLVMATESTPRGSASVVARWGESLVAVAWEALLAVATTAARGGSDVGARGVPVGLRITSGSMVVEVDHAPAAELF